MESKSPQNKMPKIKDEKTHRIEIKKEKKNLKIAKPDNKEKYTKNHTYQEKQKHEKCKKNEGKRREITANENNHI